MSFSPKHLRNRNKNVRRQLFEDNFEEISDDVSHEEEFVSKHVNNKQRKRDRIEAGLQYKDSYNIHKRYEKLSNTKIYLGEDITVNLLSWEITRNRRKPFLFFNDVLFHIWPENILRNRCLDKIRTTYKSSDGTAVTELTPQKLSLTLSLYNDYLSELNINDGKRIKYLCDSFRIIYAKIRDARIKYKKKKKNST